MQRVGFSADVTLAHSGEEKWLISAQARPPIEALPAQNGFLFLLEKRDLEGIKWLHCQKAFYRIIL